MSNSEFGENIVSPFGKITFLAVKYPVFKFKSKDPETKEYRVRIQFDRRIPEHAEFEAEIMAVNDRIVAPVLKDPKDKRSVDPNLFAISARRSKNAKSPKVLNEQGRLMEEDEVPMYHSSTDSGEARIEVTPAQGPNGGFIVLHAVQLRNLVLAPKEEREFSPSKLEAAIRAEHDDVAQQDS